MSDNKLTGDRNTSLLNISLTVGPMLLCIVLAWTTFYYRDKTEAAQSDLSDAYFRRSAVEEDIRRLRQMIHDYDNPPLQLKPTLTMIEFGMLQKRGFEDPYNDLAHDLTTNPQIFARDGNPLTIINIMSKDDTCILGPDRALAYYEIGDEHGRMLLSYDISESNQITWRVLEKWAGE